MEYKSENKICKNCKCDFIIEPDDFSFYEKIKVPPPTFCPECRYIRRLLDRNEYNFYKRKCDATGESIISIYRENVSFPVYKQEYWKSDKFDAVKYGRDFDFNKSFFEQYEELRDIVPHLAMVNASSVNSEYTNQSQNNKDCYMLVTSGSNEKCMYGSWCQWGCYFLSDCYLAEKSEYCYECINIKKCSHCLWSSDCSDCVNVYFSNDCKGCTDCFGCVGLRNKQYFYFNKNIGKDEYEKKVKNFEWDRDFIKKSQEEAFKLRLSMPIKFYHGVQVQQSNGDYIENTQRMKLGFNCHKNKDTAYMQDAWDSEDCRDCTEIITGQLAYEAQGVEAPHRSMIIRSCFGTITDSYYCDMCFGVENCFGCFGLKKKSYCILNKQYSKSDYFSLKEKIIKHMIDIEEWGEYFPANFSPFAYNESMAQDYFPLNKEEAKRKGYKWYDRPERDYKIFIPAEKIPKTFSEIKENILEEAIQCSSQKLNDYKDEYPLCTTAFKITSLELSLYKILNLPIPEKCFACRRTDRFMLRNPRNLWHRKCMKEGCNNEFETSYAPDRPEIVYCENCYNKEVY
ncbi:MAG: hypothetical protein NDI62_02000 [Burkholderiales bacterium]|nr:hypothetical protein [Burkholderiales bacterium]